MRKVSYIKKTPSGTAFDIFNAIFMTILTIVMIYPFINIFAISLNEGTDAVRGGIYLWPRKFTMSNYEYVFSNSSLLRGAMVSVLRVLVGVTTGVIGNAMLGYIVSCRTFYGRKFMRILFLITMYFSGGLIPTYLLMIRLGYMNTFQVYWVPSIFSAFYMLLAASYIQNLPDALFEAARLDGCSELRILFSIVLPLCIPMLACIAVYLGVDQWNSWFDVSLYSKDGKWDNLQIILYRLLNQSTALQKMMEKQRAAVAMKTLQPLTVRAATTIVVTIPIIFIYPFFQKYFVSGITIGSVKG
ncbi:MAG: carbohydrate ABC transporter permease [Eubacteriales bacterium]|nr:carbohydrate ABC transporter permease [Eubacteriales bacterium]